MYCHVFVMKLRVEFYLFIYIIKSYAKYTVNDKKRKKAKTKIKKVYVAE